MYSTICCICKLLVQVIVICGSKPMFNQFGFKWIALHYGLMWSVAFNDGEVHSNIRDTVTVRIQTITDHVI